MSENNKAWKDFKKSTLPILLGLGTITIGGALLYHTLANNSQTQTLNKNGVTVTVTP